MKLSSLFGSSSGMGGSTPQPFLGLEALEKRLLLSGSPLQWQPLGEPGSGGRLDAVHVSPHDPERVLLAGDILGTGLSENGGQTWQPTTGFQNWEHSDFAFHPDKPEVVWAGTLGGPYRSDDGGSTWQSKRSGMPPSVGYGFPAAVESVLFDAGDPTGNTLLAFGGDHRQLKDYGNPDQVRNYGKVWRSTTGGESWSEYGEIPTGSPDAADNNVMAVAFGGGSHETVWAALAEGSVYRSSNDGDAGSWVRRANGLPELGNGVRVTGLVAHPTDPKILVATVGTHNGNQNNREHVGGVFRTTDEGLSWVRVEDGDPSGYWPPNFLHVDISSDGNTLWATDATYDAGKGLYKSVDAGATWEHALTQGNVAGKLVGGSAFRAADTVQARWVEIDPSDPQTVYAASSFNVIKTSDGGVTWRDVTNATAADGTSRGNGYAGWVAENVEFNPFDADQVVVQGWDLLAAGLSDDGGNSWRIGQAGLPSYVRGNDAAFAQDGTIFVATDDYGSSNNKIHRSTDGGRVWESLRQPENSGGRSTGVHVNHADADEVWLSLGGKLYHSTNALAPAGEVTWRRIDVDGRSVGQIEPVLHKRDNFYVSTSGGVFYTSDGGATFETTDTPGAAVNSPTGRVKLAVDPGNGQNLWAAVNGGSDRGVYHYLNDTWKKVSLPGAAGDWASDIAIDPTDPDRIAVATQQDQYIDVTAATGVWVSEDGGATWSQENANLPQLRVKTITFSPDGGELLLGTNGRGFFSAEVGRSTVGIQAERMNLGKDGERSFRVGGDAGAGGGRFIEVADGGGNSWSADADAPVAQFSFTLDEAEAGVGFRGRVQTPGGGNDDSFWFRVDGGGWKLWDTPVNATGWSWGPLTDRGVAGAFTADLDAGRHTLEIKLREDGARLDAVEVVLAEPAAAAPLRVQAEAFSGNSGTRIVGGTKVGYTDDGDSLRFDGIGFGAGGSSELAARLASDGAGGTVHVRLDDPAGTPIASLYQAPTGGWNAWKVTQAGFPRTVRGVHDVYLEFVGTPGAPLLDIDWFEFRP